jgi:hypothetical protein
LEKYREGVGDHPELPDRVRTAGSLREVIEYGLQLSKKRQIQREYCGIIFYRWDIVLSCMPKKEEPVSESCMQRTKLWAELWRLTGGLSNVITRAELEKRIVPFEVPGHVVFPCLMTFCMQKLIICIKNDKPLPFSVTESNYGQFILAPDGCDMGPNYKCRKEDESAGT